VLTCGVPERLTQGHREQPLLVPPLAATTLARLGAYPRDRTTPRKNCTPASHRPVESSADSHWVPASEARSNHPAPTTYIQRRDLNLPPRPSEGEELVSEADMA
jgi:hypothetical protein